jgi:ApbE family
MTRVGIASIDDGGLQRSQLIDQQALPVLEQEAMQAQSASIQGVSGASYTSASFQQSLQAEVVYLTGAIATSGAYERGDHLIDPHTGRPMARAASATVTGPDLGLADALATAVAVAGAPGLDVVEALDGYEALIIALDGRHRWTRHFPFAPREAAVPR